MMSDAERATGAARGARATHSDADQRGAKDSRGRHESCAGDNAGDAESAEDGAGSCAERDDQSCMESDAPQTRTREHQRGRECEHEHEQHEHIMNTRTPRSTNQRESDPKNHLATTRGWSKGREGAWKRDGTTPHG